MEHIAHEPIRILPSATIRHDGWTGDKMATFCETLAETAVVAEACDQAGMGISGAYALRRRNRVFAAAWDAALTIARERLADTLLARSIEGNVEQIYKDGVLVGERHVIDNRLGLAILRRLDRLAETGLSVSRRGERAPTAPAPSAQPVDWDLALGALRTGDPDDVCAALAMLKGGEVEEVEGPPVSLIAGDGLPEDSAAESCWFADGRWLTHFPPPAGFDGHQNGDYGDFGYERACTPEEVALLEASAAAAENEERARGEAARDSWFAELRAGLGTSA